MEGEGRRGERNEFLFELSGGSKYRVFKKAAFNCLTFGILLSNPDFSSLLGKLTGCFQN